MRKIVGLVIVLGVLVGLDLLARNVAEQQVADQVKSEVSGNATVHATIPSFPFIARLLIGGSVPKVTVKVEHLAGPPISLAEVDVTVRGVAVNRRNLVRRQRVDLVSIDKGSVAVEITQSALTDVLHKPVTIAGGSVTIVVNGQTLTAAPSITKDNRLALTPVGGGAALEVGVGQPNLVPCSGHVTLQPGKVLLTCTFTRIPHAFVRAANAK